MKKQITIGALVLCSAAVTATAVVATQTSAQQSKLNTYKLQNLAPQQALRQDGRASYFLGAQDTVSALEKAKEGVNKFIDRKTKHITSRSVDALREKGNTKLAGYAWAINMALETYKEVVGKTESLSELFNYAVDSNQIKHILKYLKEWEHQIESAKARKRDHDKVVSEEDMKLTFEDVKRVYEIILSSKYNHLLGAKYIGKQAKDNHITQIGGSQIRSDREEFLKWFKWKKEWFSRDITMDQAKDEVLKIQEDKFPTLKEKADQYEKNHTIAREMQNYLATLPNEIDGKYLEDANRVNIVKIGRQFYDNNGKELLTVHLFPWFKEELYQWSVLITQERIKKSNDIFYYVTVTDGKLTFKKRIGINWGTPAAKISDEQYLEFKKQATLETASALLPEINVREEYLSNYLQRDLAKFAEYNDFAKQMKEDIKNAKSISELDKLTESQSIWSEKVELGKKLETINATISWGEY